MLKNKLKIKYVISVLLFFTSNIYAENTKQDISGDSSNIISGNTAPITIYNVTTRSFHAVETLKTSPRKEEPKGWYVWGRETHKVMVDKTIYHSKPTSFSVMSLTNSGRGGFTQSNLSSDDYKGKKVKLSGYFKTKDVPHAFIWFFAKDDKKNTLKEEDMYIKGSKEYDWTPFEIIMKVPSNSKTVSFGINLGKQGQMWVDDIKFEIVPKDTPEKTDSFISKKRPVNLS